ncbi:hypothetical protein N7539_005563 [Penicillium diatomitis]|uniref:Uncharacterized protein n=1 Tax=Penicillium diatomitis TaxID=2819901 RepID=A0A9W9X8E4_9EURO|nr:uncharacterized protein N7539_005563 [Penicillium diatomitis]KAJ5485575.1 hypothetical protein N7539_005563 [Penicillium diatomitis]
MSSGSNSGSIAGETSPRKKRRFTDGGLADTLKIEDYLYSIDAHRATTAPFPLPFPLKRESAPGVLRDQFWANRDAFKEILAKEGFNDNRDLFPVNVSKPGYLGGHPPARLSWLNLAPLRDHLKRFLVAKEISADVEVVNVDYCYQPGWFAISPSHPAVDVYKKIKPRLLQRLRTEIPFDWTSLTLVLLGRERLTASPSIIITVNQQSSHSWFDLVNWVRSLISENSPSGLSIKVDFIPGRFDSSPERSTSSQDEYTADGRSQFRSCGTDGLSHLGLSIGESGQTRAGTMGALVMVTHNGQTYKCGITNHHVVQPTVSKNDVDRRANQFGVPISNFDKLSSRMEFFASMDVAATRRLVDADLAEAIVELENLEETALGAELKHGEVAQSIQYRLEIAKDDHARLTEQRDFLSQLPRPLGNVLCSSGQGVWGGRVQDWALIELGEESLASMAPTIDMGEIWRLIDKGSPTPRLNLAVIDRDANRNSFPEKRFSKIVPGKWYTRIGRSSVKSGIANGVHVCLNWAGNDNIQYDLSGAQVAMDQSDTEEHLIIAQTDETSPMSIKFGDPGDSGSVVLDEFGTICGLYYGNVTRWAGPDHEIEGNAGLAMSMDDLEEGGEKEIWSRYCLESCLLKTP